MKKRIIWTLSVTCLLHLGFILYLTALHRLRSTPSSYLNRCSDTSSGERFFSAQKNLPPQG